MSARVTILLLAIGVFVAIWSGDRRTGVESPSIAAHADGRLVDASDEPEFNGLLEGREEAKPGIQRVELASAGAGSVRLSTEAVRRAPRPMVANRKHDPGTDLSRTRGVFPIPGFCDAVGIADSIADIPLPGGITPGEYRIARSDGAVLRIRLTAEELARRGLTSTDSPRGHYLLHDGRMRWYFIRIDAPMSEVATGGPRAAVLMDDAPPVIAQKPRPVDDVLREWIAEAESLLIRPLQTAHSAARLAVRRSVDELQVRWRDGVAVAAEQWDHAIARARRMAAGSGASRR